MKSFFKILLWILFYLPATIPVYVAMAEVGGWLGMVLFISTLAPFSVYSTALWKWIDGTIEARESPQIPDLHPKKSI
jgi:hypothetical protein